MDRAIKFRAKRNSDTNRDWVYGVPVPNFAEEGWMLTKDGTCINVDVNTLCEYTNMTDENNEEIYEGDVVFCYSVSSQSDMMDMVVTFTAGGFRLIPYADYFHLSPPQKMVIDYPLWRFRKTVVGNIYNNEEGEMKTKTGKWLDMGHDGTTHTYACSRCGHTECDNMTKHDAYCCSCGAHMIEEE